MEKKVYVCKKGKKSSVIIEDLTVHIKEGATLVLGFAGIGLIGPIVANQLIEQIPDIKEIGFITSEYLPPIAVFYQGVLRHPFRLLYSPQYNLIVGICEVPFQVATAYNDLSKTICNWALNDDVKAKEIKIDKKQKSFIWDMFSRQPCFICPFHEKCNETNSDQFNPHHCPWLTEWIEISLERKEYDVNFDEIEARLQDS